MQIINCYNFAFVAETVASAGPICSSSAQPCILGSGGGLAVRIGHRSAGPLYLGGAYELSKQDPNKLYRLGILQQARFEARYYFLLQNDFEPYLSLGVGAVGYGNEFSIQTYGPMAQVVIGIEAQLSRRTVVGLAVAYRLLDFRRFEDTTGTQRSPGVAQMFGLELTLEGRDPL